MRFYGEWYEIYHVQNVVQFFFWNTLYYLNISELTATDRTTLIVGVKRMFARQRRAALTFTDDRTTLKYHAQAHAFFCHLANKAVYTLVQIQTGLWQ